MGLCDYILFGGVVIIFLGVALAFLPGFRRKDIGTFNPADFIKKISNEELFELIQKDKNTILFDIRRNWEMAVGSIDHKNSYFYKMGQLAELPNAPENPGRDGKIVVICFTGQRGAFGAESLVEAGYRDVSCLEDGMESWVNEGFPIVPTPERAYSEE